MTPAVGWACWPSARHAVLAGSRFISSSKRIIAPSVKVAADGRNWWKVVGQYAPLAASRRDIQDRVEHIACVSVALSGMLAAGEFGPGHGGLRSDL